jgi:hypothetical protein
MAEGVAYAAMRAGFVRARRGNSNCGDDGCKKWLTFVTKIISAMTLVPRSTIIFLLTSFFINSIHQLVAVERPLHVSMKNGRENRNNGNQKEGKEEKETLSSFSTK